jgi:hypothetical protein
MLRALLAASTLLAGCALDEPGAEGPMPQADATARAEILDLGCTRMPDRIVLEGTVDVTLDVGQTFEVAHYAAVHFGRVSTTLSCGNWATRRSTAQPAVDTGCDRVSDMPDSELISFHRELDVVSAVQTQTIEIEVAARVMLAGSARPAVWSMTRVACTLAD